MKRMKITKSILLIIGIIFYSIVSVFYIIPWSKSQIILSSFNQNINHILSYQIVTLAITLIFLFFIYISNKDIFKIYFKIGDSKSKVLPEAIIGLKPKKYDNWKSIGINFTVIITVVTIIVMYFSITDKTFNYNNFLTFIPFVFIFSLSNSFVEEIMYRFGVIIALKNIISDKKIALISGLIFGSIHYFGTPGGLIGVIVAGFLGWFLAKSIIETKGIFWAYLIHFLQDFVIFSALLLFI
ncbi:CPBP family intramembrane metalloprotease [Candidatus Peregrinibacteria bacterium]|nr:CPBP family intramembrane metalloprotease [Candidatus Peregrinibacteria bacterium]